MSTEIKKIKEKISILRKILLIYQQWLALIMKNRPVVILHHSATSRDETKFEAINQDHKNRGYSKSKLSEKGESELT